MKRTGWPGYREYFRRGPVRMCRIGSWDSPHYALFGAWRHGHGFTLRFRGYLLTLGE